MNDLQRELRAAFERQQAGLGDTAGLRQRMIRKAVTANEPRRSQIFRTAVGLAAVLVAAAAVGTTIFIRARSQVSPAVTSTPSVFPSVTATLSPAPTPMAQQLQVPLTTPVMLFHDPVNSDQIDGITWDGSAPGWVARTAGAAGLVPNYSGTLYAAFKDRAIHDRTGQSLGPMSDTDKGFGLWADDERHYCQLVKFAVPGAETVTLQLVAPGEAPRTIASFGKVGEHTNLTLASCSVELDRAVVAGPSGSVFTIAVVKLSTGRNVWTHSYSSDIVGVSASRDGQYVAATSGRMDQLQGWMTTVYGADGSPLARVAGRTNAFSWDGSLAVVDYPGVAPSVVRWRDGTFLWKAPDGATYEDSLPEPGASRIAVAVRNPAYPWGSDGFPRLDAYVVGPDGHSVEILQRVTVAF